MGPHWASIGWPVDAHWMPIGFQLMQNLNAIICPIGLQLMAPLGAHCMPIGCLFDANLILIGCPLGANLMHI